MLNQNPRTHQSARSRDDSSSPVRRISWTDDQDISTSPKTTTMLSSPHASRYGGANESTPIMRHGPQITRNYSSTANRDNDADRSQPHGESSQGTRQRNGTSAGNANRPEDQPNRDGNDSDNDDKTRPAWHKRLAEKYGALELDNKGSVARDHLALERTFLAWLRTSLAFASIGIAVTQLFRLNTTLSSENSNAQGLGVHRSVDVLPPSSTGSQSLLDLLIFDSNSSNGASRLKNVGKPLGATFIGIAILILVIGFHRYFESQYWIVRGKFPASRGSVALVTFVAAALIVSSLVVVLVIGGSSIET